MNRLSSITVLLMVFCAISDDIYALNTNEFQTIAMHDKEQHLHWFKKDNHGKFYRIENATKTMTAFRLKNHLLSAPLPLENVKAGGIGGNERTGFIYYDGQPGKGHAAALEIQRNPFNQICYMQNAAIVVRDWNHDLDIVEFPCKEPDKEHNNLYWYPGINMTNGNYNPALDAFYAAQMANNIYQSWFHSFIWDKDGEAAKLIILLHAKESYFDFGGFFASLSVPWFISISDGDKEFYPETTLDTVVRNIAKGMALSHWGYSWGVGDSPAIAISYTDMFAKAVEYAITGENDWSIGKYFSKEETALRYMDNPKKDCHYGEVPGVDCSIDNYHEYEENDVLDPEFGAGLMNKIFYTLATTPGWNTKDTFLLFDHAMHYLFIYDNPNDEWPENNFTFEGIACGLLMSAHDFNYDQTKLSELTTVLDEAGLDKRMCHVRGKV